LGTLSFEIPLFAIDEEHHVTLHDVKRRPLDEFTFVVAEQNGATVDGATTEGGEYSCVMNHVTAVPPGASGGDCIWEQPAVAGNDTPDDTAAPPETTTSVETTVEETSEGDPWSLLLIPGAALAIGGGLVLDEERRTRAGLRIAPKPKGPTSKDITPKPKEKFPTAKDITPKPKEKFPTAKDITPKEKGPTSKDITPKPKGPTSKDITPKEKGPTSKDIEPKK